MLRLPSALGIVPLHFTSLISSETIEVITESGGRHFFVHGSVLEATQSEILCSPAATWKETKKIDLSSWDGDTAGRFIEFLYFGDYHFPESVLEDDGARDDDDYDEWEREGLPILVHMKVYALAKYKGVKRLEDIALERLKVTLQEIDEQLSRGTSRVAADVIELLEYVYSDAGSDKCPWESVRELVLAFAAKNFEKLMNRRRMRVLFSEGDDLTVELMEKVASRVCGSGMSCGAKNFCVGRRLRDVENEAQDWKDQAQDWKDQVQDWKDQAAALKEKIRQLETTSAEKVQQLEATSTRAQQLAATYEERIREFEMANASRLRQVEVSRSKVRQLEATNADLRKLEEASSGKIRRLEANIRRLRAATADAEILAVEDAYLRRIGEW